MSDTNGVNGHQFDLSIPLKEEDPEIYDIIVKEKERQLCGLEMIASENFTSLAVQNCLGSCLTNKYSEGMVGQRYYGGNEHIDTIERICMKRALTAFGLSPDQWGVNVQPYSGSPANFAVFTGLVGPHGRIMGLDLPDGGHLTHGFYTATRKVSATSIFFESLPYKVNPKTGLIDYDKLEETALLFRPNMIIAGISCYPRPLDYARFRAICDRVGGGCLLLADMSHVSGLVAAGIAPSPFEFCDVVTTTTHKTLRGPRSGVIFYRQGQRSVDKSGSPVLYDLGPKINNAVFPGLQGGPHNHQIAGVAVAMRQAATSQFAKYQEQVVANARQLAESLMAAGYKVVTDGTDTHIVWLDLRPHKLSGGKAEKILEEVSIAVNKNTVPGDVSAFSPGGLRFGTPALTTRGFKEDDMKIVADFCLKAFDIALEAQKVSGPKLVEFRRILGTEEFHEKITSVRNQVESFAKKFHMPGNPEF